MKTLTIFLFFGLMISCGVQKNLTQEKKEINSFMDAWHQAAAVADGETYFNSFAEDGVFLGTDASENWTADELKKWSKDIFKKDTAWAFQAYDRKIYFSEDGKIAWFDELLNTWMGTCKGSGVLQKKKGKWKIEHYNLSIAVSNDVVDEYLRMINIRE